MTQFNFGRGFCCLVAIPYLPNLKYKWDIFTIMLRWYCPVDIGLHWTLSKSHFSRQINISKANSANIYNYKKKKEEEENLIFVKWFRSMIQIEIIILIQRGFVILAESVCVCLCAKVWLWECFTVHSEAIVAHQQESGVITMCHYSESHWLILTLTLTLTLTPIRNPVRTIDT